jgi:hypothetical protein
MYASYGVAPASASVAGFFAHRLSEYSSEARSIVGDGGSLTNTSAWARPGRRGAELRLLHLLGPLVVLVSACSAVQTQENTIQQISTIENIRYNQVLTNLSNAIDEADAVPSQGVTSNGVATNVATGSVAFNLTQPFDFAHNTKTFTPMAGVNWQNNWTITPISDPQDLQNLRALYSLLYRSDIDVAQFIINTLTLYASRSEGSIDTDWMATQQLNCGISWSRNEIVITNPDAAAVSYLGAWNAFPEPSNIGEKSSCYSIYGVLGQPLGNPTSSLAAQYGLIYPPKKVVLAELRNGLSPECRNYQLINLIINDLQNSGKKKFRQDKLFERWLFWKKVDGTWSPYTPPSSPEYLGKYGDRDFWITSRACLADFIVLAINATANSHAAAQNAPKQTGPTPATPGT